MHILLRVSLIMISTTLLLPEAVPAAEVFTWKSKSGSSTYSDVPQSLRSSHTQRIKIRQTKTVAPKTASRKADYSTDNTSIGEQQQRLSEKIAKQNTAIEKQNRQIAKQNSRQKYANCQTAKINLHMAQQSKSVDRAELLASYRQDVDAFCSN